MLSPVNGSSPELRATLGAGVGAAVTCGFAEPFAPLLAAFTCGCSLAIDVVWLSYCVLTGVAPAIGAPTIATTAPVARATASRLVMVRTITTGAEALYWPYG